MVVYVRVSLVLAGAPAPDERPAAGGEWGFRPRSGEACAVDPPAFMVRPQKGAQRYEFAVARDESGTDVAYRGENSQACWCPSEVLREGTWFWRFRFTHHCVFIRFLWKCSAGFFLTALSTLLLEVLYFIWYLLAFIRDHIRKWLVRIFVHCIYGRQV